MLPFLHRQLEYARLLQGVGFVSRVPRKKPRANRYWAAELFDSEAQMTYQFMAACCGQSIYANDFQDQNDLDRREGEGGAPARHPLRTHCAKARRAGAGPTSAVDIGAREAGLDATYMKGGHWAWKAIGDITKPFSEGVAS